MALVISTSVRLWGTMRRCLRCTSRLRHAALLWLRCTHLLLLWRAHRLRLWRAHLLLLWCTHRLLLRRTHLLLLRRRLRLTRMGEVFLVMRRAWNPSALNGLALLRVKRPARVVLHTSLLLLKGGLLGRRFVMYHQRLRGIAPTIPIGGHRRPVVTAALILRPRLVPRQRSGLGVHGHSRARWHGGSIAGDQWTFIGARRRVGVRGLHASRSRTRANRLRSPDILLTWSLRYGPLL
jgi:hypothetical protein